jgi:hypothetical protein
VGGKEKETVTAKMTTEWWRFYSEKIIESITAIVAAKSASAQTLFLKVGPLLDPASRP